MLTIKAVAIQRDMDVMASTLLRIEELCQICAQWMQEQNEGGFLADDFHILVRKRDHSCLCKTNTLGEIGVENNEIFYLF